MAISLSVRNWRTRPSALRKLTEVVNTGVELAKATATTVRLAVHRRFRSGYHERKLTQLRQELLAKTDPTVPTTIAKANTEVEDDNRPFTFGFFEAVQQAVGTLAILTGNGVVSHRIPSMLMQQLGVNGFGHVAGERESAGWGAVVKAAAGIVTGTAPVVATYIATGNGGLAAGVGLASYGALGAVNQLRDIADTAMTAGQRAAAAIVQAGTNVWSGLMVWQVTEWLAKSNNPDIKTAGSPQLLAAGIALGGAWIAASHWWRYCCRNVVDDAQTADVQPSPDAENGSAIASAEVSGPTTEPSVSILDAVRGKRRSGNIKREERLGYLPAHRRPRLA